MTDRRYDVVLAGGGGAALSLLQQLALRGPRRLRVLVVDPVQRLVEQPHDRTWCSWGSGPSDVDRAVAHRWTTAVVRPESGDADDVVLNLRPMRYSMVRSDDYAALVADVVDRAASSRELQVDWLVDAVLHVEDGDPARVSTVSHGVVEARWVFDSRRREPRWEPRTTLLQHFRGAFVHAPHAPFVPERALLMDFTTPQPDHGLSFGYVLPTSRTDALVEYTEFSRRPLTDEAYERALSDYVRRVAGPGAQVRQVEQGAIPMTDAVHERRTGRSVLHVGTSGGATRGSTGYTFAAMQRQARAVADAMVAGRDPLPPRAYPRRHGLADAVMLRALDRDLVDGPEFFARLFARNPPTRLLRFLDGLSSPAEELAVLATAPTLPMLRASAWLLVHPRARQGVTVVP